MYEPPFTPCVVPFRGLLGGSRRRSSGATPPWPQLTPGACIISQEPESAFWRHKKAYPRAQRCGQPSEDVGNVKLGIFGVVDMSYFVVPQLHGNIFRNAYDRYAIHT